MSSLYYFLQYNILLNCICKGGTIIFSVLTGIRGSRNRWGFCTEAEKKGEGIFFVRLFPVGESFPKNRKPMPRGGRQCSFCIFEADSEARGLPSLPSLSLSLTHSSSPPGTLRGSWGLTVRITDQIRAILSPSHPPSLCSFYLLILLPIAYILIERCWERGGERDNSQET